MVKGAGEVKVIVAMVVGEEIEGEDRGEEGEGEGEAGEVEGDLTCRDVMYENLVSGLYRQSGC